MKIIIKIIAAPIAVVGAILSFPLLPEVISYFVASYHTDGFWAFLGLALLTDALLRIVGFAFIALGALAFQKN
jgi:hypothetical protein